ncbi:hypothetical protein EJ04DRAFT_432617 [Polyplosphaeria fusca]|uniref:Uncharacterized protein n=1 Tax=Polyplosphaeria fusca TaxID=682080 RepID=A0A9P4V1S6_9PLEO|nr:hypothetical protein EJ04DRAFT_432617 [Polyplosphaeria fusca]
MPPRKRGVMNTLYPPGEKPGAAGRMKNHCRRFWWCDLLVIAIIALVIVLPVIFVAIPKKAQHDINASTLEVTSQEITDPSPDGLHLKLVSLAKSGSDFHPTLDAFSASLALEGKDPFLYLNVPETKAEAETTITVDQDIKFESLDRFVEYNKVVMGSETFDVYLSGKTKVHQSGLKAISVDYNKKITMKGLNKLQGLNITDLKILDKPLSDGSNMVGNVTIDNPSVMTLTLGNVTMNLSVDSNPIGTSLLPDMVLKPGQNTIPMQSNVNQSTVLTMVVSKYQNAILPLEIVGNSSVVGGQHLTYFESAIKENTIKLDLNVGPALAALGINPSSLGGGS